MAMLRFSDAGGLKVLVLAVLVTLIPGAGKGTSAETAPRNQWRVPRWVENMGDRPDSRAPAPKQSRSETAPRTRNSAAPQKSLAAEAAAPVPGIPPANPSAATAPGSPLEIAATPQSDAAGKPGRALLRSRAPAAVESQTRLISGWGEVGPEQSLEARHAIDFAFDAESPAARDELGPEASDLRVTDDSTPVSDSESQPAAAKLPTPRTLLAPPRSVAETQPPVPEDEAPAVAEAGTVDAATGTPTLSIDPASFKDICPGRSRRGEMHANMESAYGAGEPFSREDGTEGVAWVVEPFERSEFTLTDDTVDSIRIKLGDPVAVAELAHNLQVDDLRSVSILDESGVSIGEVYPERGLILSLKPGTRSALAVMIEPLDPEAFVLRAEGELDGNSNLALADLQFAVEIDPQHLRARRLLLGLLCEQGKWRQALAVAEATETLDPVDVWTRLKTASVLMSLERFDEARARVAGVRDLPDVKPLAIAQVERMLGRIEVDCPQPNYKVAVRHFDAAIRAGMPLKGAPSESIRRASRDVLLDANLGMAVAIAKGDWQKKGEVVARWLAAATKLVDGVDADADDRPLLESQLCRGALAAAAGSELVDPLPWVKRLLQTRERMTAELTDPWRRRQIDWEVGHGLADALASSQKRGESADMLDNATLTVAYLERGAEYRDLTDAERATIGDLLFRIGVLHSLQHGDHATAVTWFDKVQPLWVENACFEYHGEVGRLGESYVSMAVSYWQVDRRDDALLLCRRGIDCMVDVVDRRQLAEQTLALAYGNLSMMYAEQGEDEQSKTYAEMASRAEASDTSRQ